MKQSTGIPMYPHGLGLKVDAVDGVAELLALLPLAEDGGGAAAAVHEDGPHLIALRIRVQN